jgi:hypothetical protein
MMSTRIAALRNMGLWTMLLGVASALAACGGFNPVHSDDVDALGPEKGNADQYHRAGQPCTICHGPDGPAKLQFTMAGTVFTGLKPDSNGNFTGACGTQVLLVDSLGNTPVDPNSGRAGQAVPVNCVGNFFTTSDGSSGTLVFNPAFPVKVAIATPGLGGAPLEMNAPINREPSCGKCHQDPPYLNSPGVVTAGAPANPPSFCSAQACTEGTGASTPIVPGGQLQ